MKVLKSIFAMLAILAILFAMWSWGDFTKSRCLNNQNERRWSVGRCEEYSGQDWVQIDPVFYDPPKYNEAAKNRPEVPGKKQNYDN